MTNYHLAIDIGASSGRHILGHLEDGRLITEEVYRFDNGFSDVDGSLVWDVDALEREVKAGIKKCGEIGKIPQTVAIDTWGCDYVLLDRALNTLYPVFSYRDGRTEASYSVADKLVPRRDMFLRTGIQTQKFNTVYQLFADKMAGKLAKAAFFLMMPDYLSFKLTGEIKNEYTNATTTNLVNSLSREWDRDIINELGLESKIFGELSLPGETIGNFTYEMKKYCGFDSKVIFCPSHDTASAVAACPIEQDSAYISSGTWSLFGIESKVPILNFRAFEHNFTNEGGIEYRYRVLKNYMGMWLFQSIRRDLGKKYTYDEMMEMAMASDDYAFIDVNDPAFVSPHSMIDAIKKYVGRDMPLGSVILSAYRSLAKSYADAVRETQDITGRPIRKLHIVGGGCRDAYLNKLTSEVTSLPVTKGPIEATSTGNIMSQLIASGELRDLDEAREVIKRSFSIREV